MISLFCYSKKVNGKDLKYIIHCVFVTCLSVLSLLFPFLVLISSYRLQWYLCGSVVFVCANLAESPFPIALPWLSRVDFQGVGKLHWKGEITLIVMLALFHDHSKCSSHSCDLLPALTKKSCDSKKLLSFKQGAYVNLIESVPFLYDYLACAHAYTRTNSTQFTNQFSLCHGEKVLFEENKSIARLFAAFVYNALDLST